MINHQAKKLEELVESSNKKKSKKTRFVAITSGKGGLVKVQLAQT